MADLLQYPGEELLLFEKANNWKKYWASFLKPFIGKNVLEAGAGLGVNTNLLNDHTADRWLLAEPDQSMATVLEQKIASGELPVNCSLHRATIDTLPSGAAFDTIIYIDVLEHIQQDRQELEKAASLLCPGGRLIILSPAFSILFSPFDRAIGHYRRYTRKTLQKAIPPGFTKKKLHYIDTAGFFLSLANRLLLKQKYPTQKQVNWWDRNIVPVSRITDKIAFYSFGKTILGVWEKTGA